ncbi:MAG: hypothetical protein R3E46_04190 [Sedimenticolaceae bacterium]
MPDNLPKLAYSIPEFCEASSLKKSFVYAEIANGRLKTRKAGRRTIILPDDARAYFASLEKEQAMTDAG